MDIDISFSDHAWARLVERADAFGLHYDEAAKSVFETINSGNLALKHSSRKFVTYGRYFSSGLTFYVICKKTVLGSRMDVKVKTVIIEYGR